MELNIWRAPTDNDMYIKSEWKKAHYDRAYTRAYTTEVVQGRHGVKIISHASVVAKTVQKILDVMIAWKIDDIGRIDADIAVTKDDEFRICRGIWCENVSGQETFSHPNLSRSGFGRLLYCNTTDQSRPMSSNFPSNHHVKNLLYRFCHNRSIGL